MKKHLKLLEIIIKSEQELKDVVPYCYGEHYCGSKHSYGPVTRPCWMLCYVCSGKGFLRVDSKEFVVTEGQCFVLPPNTESFHVADADEPWHYIWIEFTTTLNMPETLNNYVIEAKFIEHIFLSMRRVQKIHSDRGIWFAEKIYNIISCIQEKEVEERIGVKYYVESAVNIIETEFFSDINVSVLASRLGLNRSYFSSIFKQYTGESPMHYLTRYRLERAGELITVRDYSVSAAAEALGYADIFSFSKAFKRFYGMTPSDYKKQNKPK